MYQNSITIETNMKETRLEDRYREVRAALLLRDITFTKWCDSKKLCRQYATIVLKGKRSGKRALLLRECILSEILGKDM
jgi:ribosomal protein S19E (S16A)